MMHDWDDEDLDPRPKRWVRWLALLLSIGLALLVIDSFVAWLLS
jgi:hypothetical protein